MRVICMSGSMSEVWKRVMVEPVRHRQTKGAVTDMVDLQPPRHTSTLPRADYSVGDDGARLAVERQLNRVADYLAGIRRDLDL